jgi:peroxiredoxin
LCRDFEVLAASGAVVVVLPQRPQTLESYLQKQPLPFPLLPDEDRSRSKDWGVYHPLGIDAFRTARPASFVVGGDGKLRYVHVGSTQFRSAPVEVLAGELEAVAGA